MLQCFVLINNTTYTRAYFDPYAGVQTRVKVQRIQWFNRRFIQYIAKNLNLVLIVASELLTHIYSPIYLSEFN